MFPILSIFIVWITLNPSSGMIPGLVTIASDIAS